jgi:hypothetical protein
MGQHFLLRHYVRVSFTPEEPGEHADLLTAAALPIWLSEARLGSIPAGITNALNRHAPSVTTACPVSPIETTAGVRQALVSFVGASSLLLRQGLKCGLAIRVLCVIIVPHALSRTAGMRCGRRTGENSL